MRLSIHCCNHRIRCDASSRSALACGHGILCYMSHHNSPCKSRCNSATHWRSRSRRQAGQRWLAYSSRSYTKRLFLCPLKSAYHSHCSKSPRGCCSQCKSPSLWNHCNSSSTRNYNTFHTLNFSRRRCSHSISVHKPDCNPRNSRRWWCS